MPSDDDLMEIDLTLVASAYDLSVADYLWGEFERIAPRADPQASDLPLFSFFSASENSVWSTSWLSQLDFSGVSWHVTQAGTMVTTQHMVLATHYQRAVGQTVVFQSRSGAPVPREVAANAAVPEAITYLPDITVTRLDSPVPSDVFVYPVLGDLASVTALNGAPYLVSEQGRRIFWHLISSVGSRRIFGKKNTDWPDDMAKSLISGDSGNPAFIVVEGIPVLLSTHTFAGFGAGPFYGDPQSKQEIRAIIDAD